MEFPGLEKDSLQAWLALTGVAALLAMAGYNAWLSWRAGAWRRQRSVDAAAAAGPTPAGPAGAQEPRFEADGTTPASAGSAPDPTLPASLDPDERKLQAALAALPRRKPNGPRVDALIDAIVPLMPEAKVSGETALAHQPPTRRAGAKPFLIEGLNDSTNEWEPPRAGAFYREFHAGLQLANRHGALNEIEYSEFVQRIQDYADAIGARADFPDMLEEVARARELDAFAGEHDAQLAMVLRARKAPWPLPFVQQHASRHGFVPGATPGRLVLPSQEAGAPPMLSLQFDPQAALADDPKQTQLVEVTLAFDVPQTALRDEPFNAWCATGHALAIGLDAEVSDAEGRPLTPEAYPQIGQELLELYRRLSERDLAAGSAAARRLFS